MEINSKVKKLLMERIQSLLIESRIEDFQKRYAASLPNEIKNILIEKDPSKNHKYLDWLGKIVKTELEEFGFDRNDALNLMNVLKKFHDAVKGVDIYSVKSIEDLERIVGDVEKLPSRRKTLLSESEQLFLNENYRIVAPKSHAASMFFGGGTQWCIATSNDGYWDQYYNEGGNAIVYVIDRKTSDNRWAIVSSACDGDIDYATIYNIYDNHLSRDERSELLSSLQEQTDVDGENAYDAIQNYISSDDGEARQYEYEEKKLADEFEENKDQLIKDLVKEIEKSYNIDDLNEPFQLAVKKFGMEFLERLLHHIWYVTAGEYGNDSAGMRSIESLKRILAEEPFDNLVELMEETVKGYWLLNDLDAFVEDELERRAYDTLFDEYGTEYEEALKSVKDFLVKTANDPNQLKLPIDPTGTENTRLHSFVDLVKIIDKLGYTKLAHYLTTAKKWMKENKRMSLKKLLVEGVKEKAAEDFIAKTIKNTEWEGTVFIAGGYVRDEFMGKDPKDLDLLINKPNGGIEFANWITQRIGKYKEGSNPVTFPRFGTAKFNLYGVTHNGVDLSDMDIEAVMPRKEQYTAGSRKPDVTAGELKDDVERRDFTVNSLLKDLSSGEILDLTGQGKDDIKKGIIRTPLNPDKIFTDDPLRMLRAVRFAIKYSWKLPMFMIRALKKNAPQLKNISQERIRDELDKMLLTDHPAKAIKMLKVTGLMSYVIPELIPAVKMTQNIHHKHDVFDHTLDVLSKTKPKLVQRLMGLFHDVGKTVTKSVTPTGVHFYGHEMEGANMAEEIMKRLKYPSELINAVKLGVRNHMRLKQGGDESIKLSDKALRKFKTEMGAELEDILDVIHADNIAHSEASSMPNQIENVRKRLANLNMALGQGGKPKLPISGKDLQSDLGLKPGPIFSTIMQAVTDAWFENPNLTKEQALEIARKTSSNK